MGGFYMVKNMISLGISPARIGSTPKKLFLNSRQISIGSVKAPGEISLYTLIHHHHNVCVMFLRILEELFAH